MRPAARFSGPALCALPARDVVALLRRGEVTPDEAIAASEARVAQVEPDVNAVVTTCFDRARERAGSLASENAALAGWLAGLPVGIKDLQAVAGVRSTWGNEALRDFVPGQSDPLVELLESRGAVVVGKTNTPEFGAGGNSTNKVFGSTRNPWDTRMNAGGSSGGAAVSLATGEVWLSHGSDLMGSLRTPAAHCGVLGLRPSPGRCGGGPGGAKFLPEGLNGPMARDVRDLALFLDAMTGWDPRMPLSLEAPAVPFQVAVEQAARPPRIAFSEDQNGFAAVEREIREKLNAAMAQVAAAGAVVEEACPDLPHLNETYLAIRGMHYGTVIARLPEEVRATFGARLADNVAYGLGVTTEQLYTATARRSQLYDVMREFLTDWDVLAIPVVGIAPAPVEQEYPRLVDGREIGTYEDWLRFSFLATTTLLPALAMPAGFTEAGLPVSIQLIGPPRGEAVLLQAALFIEQALALPAGPIDPIRRH
ncbi:MAG: amidase [Pseudooceanicola sp.]|nr:amidase [Pseudooceanicola sp.]